MAGSCGGLKGKVERASESHMSRAGMGKGGRAGPQGAGRAKLCWAQRDKASSEWGPKIMCFFKVSVLITDSGDALVGAVSS